MTQGFIKTSYADVWYDRTGTKGRTPMLCLHGGPGLPSDYLRGLAALGDEREVIFYDQSGCGRSTHGLAKRYHTVSHFSDEIGIVRDALDLDRIVLFGHSWGGLIATEHLKRPSTAVGVRAAILASPMVNNVQWTEDMTRNAKTLPKELADALIVGKPRRVFERARRRFLKQYNPHRHNDEYESAIGEMNHDIRRSLWGTSMFACTGILRGYDARHHLAYIRTPTLITTGTFDGILPTTAEEIATSMPCAETATFRGAGHYAHIDYPKRYVARVRHFLHEHDA
ncbi:TPA: proline iminopeptidase-family hydrolase [Candidatus Woesearchaeota archaeon]|nr:proline iminopeptidase-family hydrolase [Candidatus Woesearchaeota archaeon]